MISDTGDVFQERLPRSLPFYGEGTLVWVPDTFEAGEPEFTHAVSFRFQSVDLESDLILAFFFEEQMDESRAMEIGNVLASRLVTRLENDGLLEGGMISPPHASRSELGFYSLLLSAFWMESRYELQSPEARHPILVRVIPTTEMNAHV